MMKRFMVTAVAAAMLAGAAFGQVNDAIEDVIGTQLQAFNDRDVETAFSFASPTIKGIFRDPSIFGTMVERGYPMVWDNRSVRFLGLREEAGMQIQTVQIEDAQGDVYTLEYAMIETANGWQINGVQIVETDLAA